jgi:hypothetical protein
MLRAPPAPAVALDRCSCAAEHLFFGEMETAVKSNGIWYWCLCGIWCTAGALAVGGFLTYLTSWPIGTVAGTVGGCVRLWLCTASNADTCGDEDYDLSERLRDSPGRQRCTRQSLLRRVELALPLPVVPPVSPAASSAVVSRLDRLAVAEILGDRHVLDGFAEFPPSAFRRPLSRAPHSSHSSNLGRRRVTFLVGPAG